MNGEKNKYIKKRTLIHFSQAMTEQLDKTTNMNIKHYTGNRNHLYRVAIKLMKSRRKTLYVPKTG